MARRQPCDRHDAAVLVDRAESRVSAAELLADDPEYAAVAAELAATAAIAASDAACCVRLGVRHRGQDHRDAVELLATVAPGGKQMANDLRRVLVRKDDAQYGIVGVAAGESGRMLDRARRLVDSARAAIET